MLKRSQQPVLPGINKLCLAVVTFCMLFWSTPVVEACTTIIIGKKATKDGSVIISHQEDYAPNDCMHLVYHPRQHYARGQMIEFAFEKVPQVPLTYSYVTDEMYDPRRLGMQPAVFVNGMNEYGVVMCSNCFRSREPHGPNNKGLGWSELAQMVMERCSTSRKGVELVGRLVEEYSFNGFETDTCKDLTFVIGDPEEGWIVHVTENHWVAKRCPDNGAIYHANQALIETDWDLACKDLENYAVEQGWYQPGSQKPFNYREIYCQGFLGMPGNLKRQKRAKELLGQLIGNITIKDLMNLNRDHYEGKPFYHPPHSSAGSRTICSSSTRSSQVFHLRGGMPAAVGCVMWIAASSPCTSVYSPVYAGHRGDFPVWWMSGSDLFDQVSA
jgi:dipeptidase